MRAGDKYADGRIKKTAFLPRTNGADGDGLSVSIEDTAYRELHRAKYQLAGRLTARIPVGAVQALGLGVQPDPLVDDLRHALITGIPDRTAGNAEKLRAEYLAQELAKQASLHNFP